MTTFRMACLGLLATTLFCGQASANLVLDTFNTVYFPGGSGVANTGGANTGAMITTANLIGRTNSAYQFVGDGGITLATGHIQYLFSDTMENVVDTPSLDIISLPITSVPNGFGQHLNLEIFSLDNAAGSVTTSLFSSSIGNLSSSVNLGTAVGSSFGLRFQFTGSGSAGVLFGDSINPVGSSSVSLVANPEPTAFLMFGSAMGIGLLRRRKRA